MSKHKTAYATICDALIDAAETAMTWRRVGRMTFGDLVEHYAPDADEAGYEAACQDVADAIDELEADGMIVGDADAGWCATIALARECDDDLADAMMRRDQDERRAEDRADWEADR